VAVLDLLAAAAGAGSVSCGKHFVW
jgi:hypothetical protein